MADGSTDASNSSQKKGKMEPDWGRFGLSNEQQRETDRLNTYDEGYREEKSNVNELFSQDKQLLSRPWWQANFFIKEPVLFGTWDGVFTSCMINIFGVVIFLRTGWVVGNAGIGLAVVIILMTIAVASLAALSAIGVCERCKMESGGVYFQLSHVLGARIGTTIGILYCFGQAVACSLYCVGFGESISGLIHQEHPDPWVSRGIALGVLLLLLVINVAGVQWVIRLQLLLLMVLFIAVLDFLVGSFVHTDWGRSAKPLPRNFHDQTAKRNFTLKPNGFLGYSDYNFRNNTGPAYLEGENFFSVFGVFFPTATGVFAGINMSGDLKLPTRNIPDGTLSAVGVSSFLYLAFVLVLGATCTRDALQTDYLIAEKVSGIGYLFLAGLYISSVSSCMGALYGAPRILQCIANEAVIPSMQFLGHGRGPNKVPVYALILNVAISLLFILFGDVNTLGPIVTMPFMMTYAFVDYAYFSLAMSFDQQKNRDARFVVRTHNGYGALSTGDKKGDLDSLFPERVNPNHAGQGRPPSVSGDAEPVDLNKSESVDSKLIDATGASEDDTQLLNEGEKKKQVNTEISSMPRSWYSFLVNRWLSLLGCLASLIIMFAIQWVYALIAVGVAVLMYVYIGHANPGVFPGIADFELISWLKTSIVNCVRGGPPPPEQIVVTPNTPAMSTMAAQLTEDNEDFGHRGRYHQSEVVKGENFDDYEE